MVSYHAFQAGGLAILLVGCGPGKSGGNRDSGQTDTVGVNDAASQDDGRTSAMDDDADDWSDAGCEFPGCYDLANFPCDLQAQNCQTGDKCVPHSTTGGTWDATKCVPVLGSGQVGEACIYDGRVAATDDCDATGMCWDTAEVDGVLQGVCYSFCSADPSQPPCAAGLSCTRVYAGQVRLCLAPCDPLLQDCDFGLGCFPGFSPTGVESAFVCLGTAGELGPGEACSDPKDCAAGLWCVQGSRVPGCVGARCCTPFCDLDAGAGSCAGLPGTDCAEVFNLPTGYENVGGCVSR